MYQPEFDTDQDFAQAPPDFKDLRARVDAAMRAMEFVGAEVEVDETAQAHARASLANPDVEMVQTPASIVHIKLLLSEYDRQVVHSTVTIRNYVTNKLIEESDNPDPRIRMKALELLGKISDVGLFTDKTEITYKHRPTEELERILQEKLMKVIDMDPTTETLANTEAVFEPIQGPTDE